MKSPVIFLIIILFAISGVVAHPADSIKMTWDSTGTILNIQVYHSVKNPNNHFISSLMVDINGKEVIKQNFFRQVDKIAQFALYKIIDVKEQDKINVTTQCNIAGKKKATIIYTRNK
ncbi:MAG: hypothetical protein N2201_04065 [candidate division WOR-3 bacterium]|nr:hypothetical protein [candidate division WOR-3 bacterium]